MFIAEAYWDLEWALQQQGFDYCYDKRLYDRLVHDGAEAVAGAPARADLGYQQRLVRFIENHDEPRAAATFSREQARAAAVATLGQTGARLVHEGQLEGRSVQLPVFLARRPDEQPDLDVHEFYDQLLHALRDGVFRDGRVAARRATRLGGKRDVAEPGRLGLARRRVAQARRREPRRRARVRPRLAAVGRPPRTGVAARRRRRAARHYERSGDDLRDGLYVALDPWSWHLFDVTPLDSPED